MERKRQREGHSLTGDSRGRDLSEHGKKATERGALTFWRWQRVTCRDTEKKQSSKQHSLSGDHRGKDLSGHKKKMTRRGHSLPGDGREKGLSGYERMAT